MTKPNYPEELPAHVENISRIAAAIIQAKPTFLDLPPGRLTEAASDIYADLLDFAITANFHFESPNFELHHDKMDDDTP